VPAFWASWPPASDPDADLPGLLSRRRATAAVRPPPCVRGRLSHVELTARPRLAVAYLAILFPVRQFARGLRERQCLDQELQQRLWKLLCRQAKVDCPVLSTSAGARRFAGRAAR